jgi:gliding motility-associated-like protein
MKTPILNQRKSQLFVNFSIVKNSSKSIQTVFRLCFLTISLLFVNNWNSQAQCTVVANAVPGVTLTYVQGGGTNATGVAFNPTLSLYYAAIAGNTGFPLETFSAAGAPLFQTNTGFDMRGMWWNPNTNQLESNGYNTGGIWKYNLNASGFALNTGISIFTGMNQPTAQSNGDYNCADNEIVYYNAGAIMRRNRTTNALIGSLAITGLPVALGNLNDNTICYTDCLAHEYALLDYVLKRVYFINKATGAYNGMSQLPASAVTNVSFRTSWANGLFWIYNTANRTWYSYQVLTGISGVCSFPVCTPPTLVINNLTACSPNTVNLNTAINVASNPGNATFYSTLANANAATSPISNIASASGTYYVRLETLTDATCFSVAAITVTINPIYSSTIAVTACQNSTVTYPDATTAVIVSNTSHVSNLLTVAGCDSIITTNVTMNSTYAITSNVTACQNSTVNFPDGTSAVISANTSHASNLLTVAGCDSIITTNVTMNPVYAITSNVAACQNSSITYPDGTTTVITANTSHISNLLTAAGCDSIITTNVTMNPVYAITSNITACQNSSITYPDGTTAVITANTSHISSILTLAGCDSIITTNIAMNPLPVSGTNGSISFCTTDPASNLFSQLGGTPAAGGLWSPSMASGSGIFNPAVDAAGTYTYSVTNLCGTASSTVSVTIASNSNPGTNGSITFCSNDPSSNLFTQLGGTPTIGGVWSPALASGTGLFNPSIDPSGTYVYTITSSCGVFTAQVIATVNPADNATFTMPSATNCTNDVNPVATITGTLGGTFTMTGGGIINASTGEVDIAATGAGAYGIIYTTSGLCAATYLYNYSILDDADASIIAAGPFCQYDSPYQLQTVNSGGTWSGTGVSATGIFDPSIANIGMNSITYTIPGICGDAQTIQIDVTATPTVSTIADTTIRLGSPVDLTSTSSAVTFSWSPSTWLDCSSCLNPISTPQETITYTITAEDNGCYATDEVTITVLYDLVVFIPNIFSPNGDSDNDVLYVRGKGIVNVKFVVFDRWGEKVFESTNLEDGWDGNFRGKKVNPAVFVYYVDVVFKDGSTVSKKGDVTLIR